MAICTWCGGEMTTVISCNVDAFHRDERRFEMHRVGDDPRGRMSGDRCGDCGAVRGGWHHPGCDIQRCPDCRGQLLSCGCLFDEDVEDDDDEWDEWDDDGDEVDDYVEAEPVGVDGNGVLVERMWVGDQEVHIHRDDLPESDITTLHGIRITTPLRTVIDIAPEVPRADLESIVEDLLERGLFTVEEAWQRLAEPDMSERRGAELLRQVLPPPSAA